MFDKQNTVRITTVVRYRARDYGERKDLPKKRIDWGVGMEQEHQTGRKKESGMREGTWEGQQLTLRAI